MVPNMFCNLLGNNHKIANNSTITEAIEKLSADSESLECYKKFDDVCLTKFKNNQKYLMSLATDF
jgi:hypothetical protein